MTNEIPNGHILRCGDVLFALEHKYVTSKEIDATINMLEKNAVDPDLCEWMASK